MNNDNDKQYWKFHRAFDDLIDNLDQNDQAKLDDLIKECGAHTKAFLCSIMESGQTLSEAIKTLELMIEILREGRQSRRRLAEENLTNAASVIIKRKLWRELERISKNQPPPIAETSLSM